MVLSGAQPHPAGGIQQVQQLSLNLQGQVAVAGAEPGSGKKPLLLSLFCVFLINNIAKHFNPLRTDRLKQERFYRGNPTVFSNQTIQLDSHRRSKQNDTVAALQIFPQMSRICFYETQI